MVDHLPQIPERSEFFSNLEEYLDYPNNNKNKCALLVIDVTQIKTIITAFGYKVGDQLLAEISQRIVKVCRDTDKLGRIDHCSFALLLGAIMNKGHASLAINKLLSVLNEPVIINEKEFSIRVSIGAAMYPEDAVDSETLIQYAEVALEQALTTECGYHFYTSQSNVDHFDSLTLVLELGKAIRQGDLMVYFQPQVYMTSRKVCGVEALLRWTHPELGVIKPSVFIPLAEQAGLIDSLTNWALNTTLRQYSEMNRMDEQLDVSFNLSAKLLGKSEIVELIKNALAIWGVAPENLMLEVTESAMMEDPKQSLDTLRQLSELGIKISIDDFGTGFSSLSYLKQLPANELKIDKSFVFGMSEERDSRKIVQSIIDLAHTFDLKVVAEGIETAEVYGLLSQMGCNIGQGYLISKAMSINEFVEWQKTSWSEIDEQPQCKIVNQKD